MRLRALSVGRDLDAGRDRYDQRAREERVREERDDPERLDARRDQRAARREEVRRRSRRRCYAYPVGGDPGYRAGLEAQAERHDARDLTLAHDDVVQREEALVAILGLQRGSLVHEEAALDERRKIGEARIVLVELREKAQASGVDAEQRDVV